MRCNKNYLEQIKVHTFLGMRKPILHYREAVVNDWKEQSQKTEIYAGLSFSYDITPFRLIICTKVISIAFARWQASQ